MSWQSALLEDLHKCAFFDKHLQRHKRKQLQKCSTILQLFFKTTWEPFSADFQVDYYVWRLKEWKREEERMCCWPFLPSAGPSCPSRCTLCGPDAAGFPGGTTRWQRWREITQWWAKKGHIIKVSLFVQEWKGEMNVLSLSASVCASVCKEGKRRW